MREKMKQNKKFSPVIQKKARKMGEGAVKEKTSRGNRKHSKIGDSRCTRTRSTRNTA